MITKFLRKYCWLIVSLAVMAATTTLILTVFRPQVPGDGSPNQPWTTIASHYYVAPNGNDSNPGTEARPWATLHKAATTAVAGDTVTFENGTYDIGSGEGGWNSGSSDEPITFQARNRRQVTWKQSDTGSSVNLDTVSYITFEGLVIRGDDTHEQTALVRMVDCDHITLGDCDIGESSQAFHGIYIRSGSNVTVTNCSIHPNNGGNDKGDGIHIERDSPNITISNCDIYHCDHEAISVTGCDGLLIDNCHLHHTGSHGIGIGHPRTRVDTVANITIRDCSIHDNDTTYDHTGTYHSNVRIHRGVENLTLLRCELYNAPTYGLWMGSPLIGPIYVYNNTIYNQGLDRVTEGAVVFDYYEDADNIAANVHFKNNIVFVTRVGPKALKERWPFTPWLQADYNLYYSSSTTEGIRRGQTNYDTFAAYQAAGYEPNSVVSRDPLFNNAASADFTLQGGSPATDAGVDIGEPYSGTAPDIGANEYTADSGATPTAWYGDCPPDPPTRTPWPVQPTYTPRPTYTPWPTHTPACPPTATLAPNPSPTPYPTATYYPTFTPYP